MFLIDDKYRKTQEYQDYISYIKTENPLMPVYLAEKCIEFSKRNPNFYKEDKNYKEVLKQPTPQPKIGNEIIQQSIKILDMNSEIEVQRNDWFKEHMYKNEDLENIIQPYNK